MKKDEIYILRGASHAFRSYQHGNGAPALAQEFADRLDELCEQAIAELPRPVSVRLYRLLNIERGAYGEPFALCDPCKATYRPPAIVDGSVMITKIADAALWECSGPDHGTEAGQ